MEPPRERLPERRDTILAHGTRMKVTIKEGGIDEDFWGTESGSIPLTVYCREDGWPAG